MRGLCSFDLFQFWRYADCYILGIMRIILFATYQLTVSDRFSTNFLAIYLLTLDDTLEKELDRGSSRPGAC
jgi:hypothetical protein